MKSFNQFCTEAFKRSGQRLARRTVYHGTSVTNADKIRRSGFKPGTRFEQDQPESDKNRIYVTTSKEKARIYANQAGPEKHGYEVNAGEQQDSNKRSPIRSPQVRINRNPKSNESRLSPVGGINKVINHITKRNKPKVLKLDVFHRIGDGKSPLVKTKTSQPDEHTMSKKQADAALRNAEALDKKRQGTIKRRRPQ